MKRKVKKASSTWAWKKELGEWFHKVGGIEKVTAPRPSTAPFGNWGVMGALRRLNDDRCDVDVATPTSRR